MNKPESFKVVFLGDTGVDKGGIISRIERSYPYPTIKGGPFTPIIIEFPDLRKSINFEIWDTAGQELYRRINKMFYHDANVVIFVYDITRRETFESIKNYYYEDVKNASYNNLILAVVANKSDLYEYREVNDNEGEEYAKKIGAIFQPTSVSKNWGISTLFDKIGRAIFSNKFERAYLYGNREKLFSLNKYLNL